jgi:putative N-acetylmannosamine-6-phosphate epimerase
VEQVERAFESGANVVVIGTAVERDSELISMIAATMKNFA